MNDVRETEIEGVLCFFVETGRPLSSARLIFRQGEADEPLHESGWLHLIEHLAALGRSDTSLRVEGAVSSLLTTFYVHATTEGAMVEGLRGLTSWLSEPDFAFLARESLALRGKAEELDDPLRRSVSRRYGAVGPGVSSYAEAGAVRATPEVLLDRAQKVFNASNAVLVLNAPPPDDLKLRLTYGEYLAPTPARSIPRRLPAAYADHRGLVLSGTVQRGLEADLFTELLERVVHDELRKRTGGAYAPWSAIEPVDFEQAVVAAGSGLVPDMLPSAVGIGLDLTRRLAETGIDHAWVEEAAQARIRELSSPNALFTVALEAAYAVLADKVPKSQEELLDDLRSVDPGRMQAVARQFHDSLLVGVPEEATVPSSLPVLSTPESTPVATGRRHLHVNWPADSSTFCVDEEVAERATGAVSQTVRLDDVAALFSWRDGTRYLVGRDGSVLVMEARQWVHGRDLTTALDEAVPAELHIPMPDRIVTFKRMGLAQRGAMTFIRFTSTRAGVIGLLGVVLFLAVWAALGGHHVVSVAFVLLGGVLGAHYWRTLSDQAGPSTPPPSPGPA
jgi:hypothetical protein